MGLVHAHTMTEEHNAPETENRRGPVMGHCMSSMCKYFANGLRNIRGRWAGLKENYLVRNSMEYAVRETRTGLAGHAPLVPDFCDHILQLFTSIEH